MLQVSKRRSCYLIDSAKAFKRLNNLLVSNRFWNSMAYMFSVYTRRQIYVLILILDNIHRATISKVIRYVSHRFLEQYFTTKLFGLYEIQLFSTAILTNNIFIWMFLLIVRAPTTIDSNTFSETLHTFSA